MFQLVGLGWAGESSELLRPFINAVIEKQKANGGWSQLDGLPSDSWATGQALVALNMVGGVGVSDAAFQKGVRFLLLQRAKFRELSKYRTRWMDER